MCFAHAIDEIELLTKFVVQLLRTVAHDLETAAMVGSIGGKRGNDNMSAWSHGTADSIDIALTIGCLCQEMKDSAIMPNVEDFRRQLYLCDIRFYPFHMRGASAKPLARHLQSRP